MSNHTGLSPQSPNKYLGPNVYLTICVTRNRSPTGADYRQPETGKLYPFNSFWLVGKDPTTGVQGDVWYLSKIVANVAYWVKLGASAGGPTLGVNVDAFTAPGTNPVLADINGLITITGAQVAAGVVGANVIRTDSIAINSFRIEIQRSTAVASTASLNNGVSHFNSAQFSVDANGFVTLFGGTTAPLLTLSDDVAVKAVPDGTGNIQLVGHVVEQGATKFSTVVQGTNLLNINPMSSSRWIVDPLGFNGTHTTIASALTSATSGETIFIMPGTYTENLTLKAGVNLTAYGSDSSQNGTGKVIISGTCTMTTAGTVNISGIQLQTNSAALLAVTGSAASIVNLQNCYLNATNNTAMTFSSSNAAAKIQCMDCSGDLGTTGIAWHTSSSAGNIAFLYCSFGNSGGSSTITSNSAGGSFYFYCAITSPVGTTGTGGISILYNNIDSAAQNAISLTANGSGSSAVKFSSFSAGSASAITIGAGATLSFFENVIGSTNTNAITGAGTIAAGLNSFTASSQTINTTTQNNIGNVQGYKGSGTTVSAGFIGEQIVDRQTVGTSLTDATTANLASISLTSGIWDVSTVSQANFTGIATLYTAGISATNNTFDLQGTDAYSSHSAFTGSSVSINIPSFRIALTTTTTYYLNAQGSFSTGTGTAFGRISATRVG